MTTPTKAAMEMAQGWLLAEIGGQPADAYCESLAHALDAFAAQQVKSACDDIAELCDHHGQHLLAVTFRKRGKP